MSERTFTKRSSDKPRRNFSRSNSSSRSSEPKGDFSSYQKEGGSSRGKPSRGGSSRRPSGPRREGGSKFSDKRTGGFKREGAPRREGSFTRSGTSKRDSSPRKDFKRDGATRRDRTPSESQMPSFEQGINQIQKFPRVFSDKKGKTTKILIESADGKSYFEELTFRRGEKVFREANPERSKLFAAIILGISQIGFKQDSKVLYLGASHGYTISFLADMVCDGEIYALDFAPRVMRDLVFLCEDKTNMAPIMADANKPQEYSEFVPKDIDVIFMDISQRNQTEIFLKNCDMFLKKDGFGLLALKARSVDVTKNPKDIFRVVRDELENNPAYSIVDYKELSPLEMDHAMFVVKKT